MACFVRVEPTEGVRRGSMHRVLQRRTFPLNEDSDSASMSDLENGGRKNARSEEGLVLRICVNTYKMLFQDGTSDWFYVEDMAPIAPNSRRLERFEERFERNNNWMKNSSREEVDAKKEAFNSYWKDN